jgi:hypothetical protein
MKSSLLSKWFPGRWDNFRTGCRFFWNARLRGIKVDSPPIFVVGCGHSGTSIVLAILGAHSRIFAVPYESGIALKDDPVRFVSESQKFDRWAVTEGKHRWAEKTPRHIHHLDSILQWCPQARVLLVLRDGRDVAWSIRERTGDLEQGINRWIKDNRAGEKYWQHPQVHVFRYEHLVRDFEGTTRGVLEFLGEDYEEGMKGYYRVPKRWYAEELTQPESRLGDNNHLRYRNWQINQPFFDGTGRWKLLSAEELGRVFALAGGMLSEYGYVDESGNGEELAGGEADRQDPGV